MPRLSFKFIVPVAALLSGIGAASASSDVSDRMTRTLALPPGAFITLQITVGDIRIAASDRKDVSLEVTRHAPTKVLLEGIAVQVEETAEALEVRAVQPEDGRDPALRTDVILSVPFAAALREIAGFEGRMELTDLRGECSARLERGEIVGRNMSGMIRLETAIGNITLENASPSPTGYIHLRTFNGDVALGLASRPADARILALALGGKVTSDIPLTMRERWGPRFGETTLGKGEPLISIDVVNGNIAIKAPASAR